MLTVFDDERPFVAPRAPQRADHATYDHRVHNSAADQEDDAQGDEIGAICAVAADGVLEIVASCQRQEGGRSDRPPLRHCWAESAGVGLRAGICVCGGVLLIVSARALTASLGSSPDRVLT